MIIKNVRITIVFLQLLVVITVTLFPCTGCELVQIFATDPSVSYHKEEFSCRHEEIVLGSDYSKKCLTPKDKCSRHVMDGLFPMDDITKLHDIAKKGMRIRKSVGGPTILDINTGYIRDSEGIENLFTRPTDIFTSEDFEHYGRIIHKLKDYLTSTFHVEDLYFTAPTFITRLDATVAWEPKGIHDEYWHAHADMNNTAHYHYSGLLYMSTYKDDFTGGRILFTSPDNYEMPQEKDLEAIIEPRAGRVIMFTSGPENTHYVEPVQSGQRFVLSFWFTCNPQRKFEIFLDGKKHTLFSHNIRDELQSQSGKKQKSTESSSAKTNVKANPRTKSNRKIPGTSEL